MTLLVIAVVVVLVLGAVVVLLRRAQRPDEAARFQHASELTGTWARSEPTQVQVSRQPEPGSGEDEPGRAGSSRD